MGTLHLSSDELSITLELNVRSEWWYFLYLTVRCLLVGLPLAMSNDLLPLHRLPEPAMAVEVGRQRQHPGNGTVVNEADEYTATTFKSA